jgi:integrase
MTGTPLTAVPGGRLEQAPTWEQVLRAVVRAEFAVEVVRPQPDDPVLFGPRCAVAGCLARGMRRIDGMRTGHLCAGHARAWRRDGEPAVRGWLRDGARSLRHQRDARPCSATGCARSISAHGLCYAHLRHWERAGRPSLAVFVADAPTVRTEATTCTVGGCAFATAARSPFCDTHLKSFRWLRGRRPELEPADYLAHLARARDSASPTFDLRGLPPLVALELGYALQARSDARGAAITPPIFGQVVRWLIDRPVDSMLIGSDAGWARAAAQRFSAGSRANPLGWLRFCRMVLARLREQHAGQRVWSWDTWPTELIDVDGRYAHQPVRRIYFSDIEPGWLRELAKRWARWRITTTTKSPASVAVTTSSLRRFTSFLAERDELPPGPQAITRVLLERYRAHVHTLAVSASRRTGLLTDLKVFLDDVRLHEWAPGLPANATYYRGEIPTARRALPRFIDEFVMGQIESDENLARLPDETTRTVILVLIETGLRSVDARHLVFDPVTVDEAGAPYLRFVNHKLSREAIIPISQRLLDQIRRQQQHVRELYGPTPALLLPAPRKNPDGARAMSASVLSARLDRWMALCDIRDAAGRPARVTSHQFRHTLGTRLINNEVPMDTVRRLLDHESPEMTARYATIKDQTLRREWERYQQRINIRGEVIALDPKGPISDAAWAKENLARAKQTLPNGFCGLPLQQTCPHPNACLTCDHFLTTPEFLPLHRDQLDRTRELLASARHNGRQRLVAMNEPVEGNLLRIIDGLEALEVGDGR